MQAGLLMFCLVFKNARHFSLLASTDDSSPRTDDGAFFCCYLFKAVTKVFAVVEADVGHGNDWSVWMSCGGIEASSEAHLKHKQLYIAGSEVIKSRCYQQLEGGESVSLGKGLKGGESLA